MHLSLQILFNNQLEHCTRANRGFTQGWEFANRSFFAKNEQMSDLPKKRSNAHSNNFGEQLERFVHIAQKRVNEKIANFFNLKKRL